MAICYHPFGEELRKKDPRILHFFTTSSTLYREFHLDGVSAKRKLERSNAKRNMKYLLPIAMVAWAVAATTLPREMSCD